MSPNEPAAGDHAADPVFAPPMTGDRLQRWLWAALAKVTGGATVHLTPDEQVAALDVTFAAADDGGVDITAQAGAEAEANSDVDPDIGLDEERDGGPDGGAAAALDEAGGS
jgi:hypothetical protein